MGDFMKTIFPAIIGCLFVVSMAHSAPAPTRAHPGHAARFVAPPVQAAPVMAPSVQVQPDAHHEIARTATEQQAPAAPQMPAAPVSAADDDAMIAMLTSERNELRRLLDDTRGEIRRCERQRSNWQVATVIGSIGVIGTGIGAYYQGRDLRNRNLELGQRQQELQRLQNQ